MGMKRILVTGGAGYIGSHIAKALAMTGYEPVAYDNLSLGHKEAVKWGPLVLGDLADTDLLKQTIKNYQIEAVIHFAAFTFVGESMKDPGKYFKNNTSYTLTLLEAMRETGVKKIVFSSSAAVYGNPEEVPISESHTLKPINPYGESKLMMERMLHWYEQAHDFRWIALRYFNAAGADPEGELGEVHDPETHLIPLVLQAALGKRDAIHIYGTDYPTSDGTAIRDYIHVTDLADAHVRALKHLSENGNSLQLNLGTGRGYSVKEVINEARIVTGCSIPVVEDARRLGDPPVLVAKADKARVQLSWMPRYSDLNTIIETAWKYCKACTH